MAVKQDAEVVAGLCVIRLQTDRLRELNDGPVGIPSLKQGKAEIMMRLGKAGLEANCCRVLGNRFANSSLDV